MPQSESNILILKPTSQFLSLIAAQVPDVDIPNLHHMQADNTAYRMPRCDSEEAVLVELEHFYPYILKYEASRIIGDTLAEKITGSFLDFLCCFKFDFPNHILLMESSTDEPKQLLRLRPKSVTFKWLDDAKGDQINLSDLLEHVGLSDLTEKTNRTPIAVKKFKNLIDESPVTQFYDGSNMNMKKIPLFDCALKKPAQQSFKIFSRYFEVELHTRLIHLH